MSQLIQAADLRQHITRIIGMTGSTAAEAAQVANNAAGRADKTASIVNELSKSFAPMPRFLLIAIAVAPTSSMLDFEAVADLAMTGA